MKFSIAVIGVNHNAAPIEIREAISFADFQCTEFIQKFKLLYPLQEIVVLSTCNRVELYIGSKHEEIDTAKVIFLLSAYHEISPNDISPYIYSYHGTEAINHLFEVTTGLDSLVIGEVEILGQVKKSYQHSLELTATGTVLNTAFQRAIAVSKNIRLETKLSYGNVSICSVACQLAEEVLGDLTGKKVLLVGTGKIGTQTLKTLRDRGASTVLVSSRKFDKACALANEFAGQAIKLEDIEEYIVDIDVVISATSAPHHIINVSMMRRIMEKREKGPIFLIDLAVPRDIDSEVKHLGGVHLYNVDSLKRIANENLKTRENKHDICQAMITDAVNEFLQQRVNKTPVKVTTQNSPALENDKVYCVTLP